MGDFLLGRRRFHDGLARLSRRQRLDRALRRGTAGLFFGLLPGLVAAAVAGTVALPVPAALVAACSAALGLAAGMLAGLLERVDARALLIRADRVLASRELASTAFELADESGDGAFSEAIIQDAADLLDRSPPRKILGRLRLPFLPFLPLCAALIAAALLFPVDLRTLLPRRDSRLTELDTIGDDLRSYGERLQDASRAEELGRNLALAQELAQLGSDMANRKLTEEEAMERMSDLEARIGQVYQMQSLDAQDGQGAGQATAGTGGSSDGEMGSGSQNPALGDQQSDQSLKDLKEMQEKLREAQRRLAPNAAAGSEGPLSAQNPDSGSATGSPSGGGTPRGEPDAGRSGTAGESGSSRPRNSGDGDGETSKGGSSPGSSPAPQKTGAPTDIPSGSSGPGLRAAGSPGEGELSQLLARALPEAGQSQTRDASVLNRYARQAESALEKDEVPLALKEYVKGYFTIIGMSGDAAAR